MKNEQKGKIQQKKCIYTIDLLVLFLEFLAGEKPIVVMIGDCQYLKDWDWNMTRRLASLVTFQFCIQLLGGAHEAGILGIGLLSFCLSGQLERLCIFEKTNAPVFSELVLDTNVEWH